MHIACHGPAGRRQHSVVLGWCNKGRAWIQWHFFLIALIIATSKAGTNLDALPPTHRSPNSPARVSRVGRPAPCAALPPGESPGSVLTRVAHPFLCPLYSVQPQESHYRPPGVSVLGVDGTGHLSWAFFFVSFISTRSSAASHAAAMPCIIPTPGVQDTVPYSSTSGMV